MAQYNQNLVFNGLGTLSLNVPLAGQYVFDGKISLPTLSSGAGQSSLVVTINQNGSPVYTGVAGAQGFRALIVCAANDLMAIVFSSSAAADLPLNVIKSTIDIWIGE